MCQDRIKQTIYKRPGIKQEEIIKKKIGTQKQVKALENKDEIIRIKEKIGRTTTYQLYLPQDAPQHPSQSRGINAP